MTVRNLHQQFPNSQEASNTFQTTTGTTIEPSSITPVKSNVIKKLNLLQKIAYFILDYTRPIFKLIEHFIDSRRTRCFSLQKLSEKLKVSGDWEFEKSQILKDKVTKVYDSFCDIHRGQPHGFGTCYVRTFAVAESLLTGKQHIYEHTLRATVDPVNYQKHFNAKIHHMEDKGNLEQLEDGTVLILARPLTDRFSSFFNEHFFKDTSSQISHACNGIVLNKKIHVLEMSHGKLQANPPVSATILEPLDDFQKRMDKAKMPRLNLVLPIGKIHQNFL